MKTLLKVSVALFCAFTLLICAFPITGSAMTIYSGDFGFEVDGYIGTASLVDYKGTNKHVTIPESFGNYPVVKISKSAFKNNTEVEEVEIGSNINKIENEAFSGCIALKTITIPKTVIEIGRGVFHGCTSLKSAVVNAPVSYLPDNSFGECPSLTDVYLSDSITEIGSSSFAKCTSLKDLSFLNKVDRIGESAFFGNGFNDIEIPSNIESLPYYAFAYSDTLNNVTIPATVTYIDTYAFSNSDNLVINCYTNSYAHSYAVENKIPYVLLDGPKTGDVNGDGVVDILDATEIQKYAAESTDFTPEQFELGDINKDGYCNVIDALLVQKSVIGAYEMPQNIIRY